jgi:hypothetical protein
MNISCDEDRSLDVEVQYNPYHCMYDIVFTLNHDDTGIHKIKYMLPDDDMHYLIEYLQSKLK